MKKKNEQWLRYSNRALSGLLMLFGFVSCDNGGGDIPVEYGMPSAKYRVKGKVIDADTQEPVPGIEVVTGAVHTGDGKEWLSYPDTLITDKDGAFATDCHQHHVLSESTPFLFSSPHLFYTLDSFRLLPYKIPYHFPKDSNRQ